MLVEQELTWYLYRKDGVFSFWLSALVENNRGPAHGDIFRIFPSGSSHVRGQQCTVAIGGNRFSHR